MMAIDLRLEGDGAWKDLADSPERILHVGNGAVLGIAALAGGMASGKPSLCLRIDLADGRVVLAETSLSLFLTAADALKARLGDPR